MKNIKEHLYKFGVLLKNRYYKIKKVFKKRNKNEPWLTYYSREERKIDFTKKSIYNYMKDSASGENELIALNYFDNKITYYDFFRHIDLCARALRDYGIKKGDIVTICMPNMPEAIYAFYACNKLGAIADIIHPLSSAEEVKIYLKESKSKYMFLVDFDYEKYKDVLESSLLYKTILVSPSESMGVVLSTGYKLLKGASIKKPKKSNKFYISYKDFLSTGINNKEEYSEKVKHTDAALILHSGGTTGKPKGILISNYSFNALAQQSAVNVIDVRPKDKILTILPIFHGFGLGVCIHTPLCLKVETILMPEYNEKRFYKIWKYDKPHIILGVPTLWEGMLKNEKFKDVDMSQLKYIVSGGDTLSIPQEIRINKFLHDHGAKVNILKGYGMTESVAATCYTFPGTNEPGSIGIPMVGNTYKIVDPQTNKELPLGKEGEICVNGPTLMMGYLNNEEETKNILKKHKDGKLWLHTGDIGYISLNGIVYYTQRLKRMIVVSGFNVYPSQIEATIAKHHDVESVCVIGIPHQYKMNVPKAYIVLKKDVKDKEKSKKEIIDMCKKELSVYAMPKEFELRESLPKTLYNKVDYKKIENEYLNQINNK